MVSKGKRSKVKFYAEKPNLVALDPQMVESGEVYKRTLYKDSKIEVALLWISPMGKIKEHEHIWECETYHDVDENVTEMCVRGQSHYCSNIDEKDWLLVLATKYF